MYADIEKGEVLNAFKIHMRDLRTLDPSFRVLPAMLMREHAIIINFEVCTLPIDHAALMQGLSHAHITPVLVMVQVVKAIIGHNRVILFEPLTAASMHMQQRLRGDHSTIFSTSMPLPR